jgi:rfaE bifunctional protein nucleotidyltransferase chain/domain
MIVRTGIRQIKGFKVFSPFLTCPLVVLTSIFSGTLALRYLTLRRYFMKTDKKIVSYEELPTIRVKTRKKGKTIVITTGCYDILHLGHILHFSYCKTKGDILLVSIGNDRTVKELKGKERPINNERFRARTVAALEYVDYVVISEESGFLDHVRLMELLRPDFYVVPQTDSILEKKRLLTENNGCSLITCRRLPPGNLKGGISTTRIAEKIRD